MGLISAAEPADTQSVGRILVIDDEPEIGPILRLALEPRGHTMLLADDGSRGLVAALGHRPALIVLDLMMPVMDGFTVLEELSLKEKTRDVPVLVLTAMSTAAVRERCIGLGAVSCITKPFDPYDVAEEIDAVLGPEAESAAELPRGNA